jgi:adenosylcobinamide-phosphate synthase
VTVLFGGGHAGEALFVLVAAALWDRVLGEPPAAMHPVVWMGRLIALLRRRARRGQARLELLQGLAIALLVPALFAGGAALALLGLADTPWLRALVGAWLFKSCFAVRALGAAAGEVRAALAAGDLPAARSGLRSLCSRDAGQLDAEQVAAGAIESVAENSSDSVIAPLFFFLLFGLPGAVAYRAINTADSMIGYRGEYEYLGKAAARLDDAVNWIPARLTAALLILAGALQGLDVRRGWRILRRDGGLTASPNAGRPMAAMAGLLGVRLTKPDHYALGDIDNPLDAHAISEAWRVAVTAAYVAFFIAGVLILKR